MKKPSKLSALVVEDEPLVRELLSRLLEREFGFDSVTQAGDGQSALKTMKGLAPDLVVADLLLPKMDGLSFSRKILEENPDVRILALSSECDEFTVSEVYRSGIMGFLDKNDMDMANLRTALDNVLEGRTYYSEAARQVIQQLIAAPDAYQKILTKRELQVVRRVAEGETHETIGKELGISAMTARRHKHNAMRKIGVHNEAELLRYAMRKGIVKSKAGLNWTGEPVK
jgi:DNA-binding NarL/FixJ family response regulator